MICISIGYIVVPEKEHLANTSPSNKNEQGTEDAAVPDQNNFAQRIPGGLSKQATALEGTAAEADLDPSPTFDHEKQLTLVQESLHRRIDTRNAVEHKDKLSMPEWEKITNPGGTFKDDVNANGMYGSNGIPDYIDLYSGVDADFIQDNISNGVATDMSALLPGSRIEDEILYNGAVRPEHDLGNGYVLATIGADNHLRLYAGIERLVSDDITFIEFEFNQNPVRIGSGSPWPLIGNRVDGDLLVRMVFANRALQFVELEQWRESGFMVVKTGNGIAGDSCQHNRDFMYCTGRPPIQHPSDGFEVWDEDYNPLDPTPADNFVEVGIDIDLLLGPQADITSVLFRTPEDIAMNNFRVFKKLAQLDGQGFTWTGLNNKRESAR
jgi:hypothetical protein